MIRLRIMSFHSANYTRARARRRRVIFDINCASIDDDGSALADTGLGEDPGFATCTYKDAGIRTYFGADGSFSSGTSTCPQGVPQSDGFDTSSQQQAPPPPPPATKTTTQAEIDNDGCAPAGHKHVDQAEIDKTPAPPPSPPPLATKTLTKPKSTKTAAPPPRRPQRRRPSRNRRRRPRPRLPRRRRRRRRFAFFLFLFLPFPAFTLLHLCASLCVLPPLPFLSSIILPPSPPLASVPLPPFPPPPSPPFRSPVPCCLVLLSNPSLLSIDLSLPSSLLPLPSCAASPTIPTLSPLVPSVHSPRRASLPASLPFYSDPQSLTTPFRCSTKAMSKPSMIQFEPPTTSSTKMPEPTQARPRPLLPPHPRPTRQQQHKHAGAHPAQRQRGRRRECAHVHLRH
ncbi:hypothetical protein B0H14DRAFT_38489 [Mycena olivaceomarginata]|nr:hypothetical protein B0H14DRAFT_38489 [Mycena olivaceomarginata]